MIQRFALFLFALSLVAGSGCAHFRKTKTVEPAVRDTLVLIAEPKVIEDSVFLTYSRTPCFGMCPVFELTLHKSGKAVYQGKNFTDRIGLYQSQWPDAALQRIQFLADSIGYFGFDEKYDNDHVTDLPSIYTSILHNGMLKSVANRYKGPRQIQVLYKELDALIETAAWKPLNSSGN